MSEPEIKTVREAAADLCLHFDYPPWLSCVCIGATRSGQPAILVMLVRRPIIGDPIPKTWHGYPVLTRVTGQMRLAGDDE